MSHKYHRPFRSVSDQVVLFFYCYSFKNGSSYILPSQIYKYTRAATSKYTIYQKKNYFFWNFFYNRIIEISLYDFLKKIFKYNIFWICTPQHIEDDIYIVGFSLEQFFFDLYMCLLSECPPTNGRPLSASDSQIKQHK